jgi:hypothetical protein
VSGVEWSGVERSGVEWSGVNGVEWSERWNLYYILNFCAVPIRRLVGS